MTEFVKIKGTTFNPSLFPFSTTSRYRSRISFSRLSRHKSIYISADSPANYKLDILILVNNYEKEKRELDMIEYDEKVMLPNEGLATKRHEGFARRRTIHNPFRSNNPIGIGIVKSHPRNLRRRGLG